MLSFKRSFGANLQELRLRRGLSQSGLADKMAALGYIVTTATVGHWETGRRMASTEALSYLSRALECPYSAFYQEIDDRLSVTDNMEQMMVEYRAYPAPEQKTLLSISKSFEGDKLAMVKYLKLCHLELPREYRREVISYGLHIRDRAEADGAVKHSPDMEYVTEAWRKLYK